MDSLNSRASTLCANVELHADRFQTRVYDIAGAKVIDFGVKTAGGLDAGIQLAQICLADLATVQLSPAEAGSRFPISVQISTDAPLLACLGSQYAGWPVQTEKFFSMGSGPFRMLRGREEMLQELKLQENIDEPNASAVGILECDQLPDSSVVEYIASECQVNAEHLVLCVAPVTSLAGTIQVIARSVETAMHKLHAVGMDPTVVRSGWGSAPLPPPADSSIQGIGRTNDAILYGGNVTLWVDADQNVIDSLGPQVPSTASSDHGRPFAEVFKSYDYDFYKVDPGLFSPAVIHFSNLRSGITRTFGRLAPEILVQSFGLEKTT